MPRYRIAVIGLAAFALAFFPRADGHFDSKGNFVISAARASAVHECSVRAAQYPEWEYGNTEFYIYRACMAEHGQVE